MSKRPVAATAAAIPAAFPLRMLRAGIAVMVLLMLASIALTWRVGENIREDMRSQIDVVTAAQKVAHYGSILELSIKAVVTSGDSEAAARYRSVQPALRETLSSLRSELSTGSHGDIVASVDDADVELIAMEYQALDLAGKGKLGQARKLVESPRYDFLVNVYFEGVRSIERHARDYVAETRSRLDFYLWTILALSFTSLVLIVVGWFAFVRPVRRWGSEVEVARALAERSALDLAVKQGELEEANRRLFKQARIDPLTGLATRLSLNEDAPKWLLSEGGPHVVCAAMCDIDYFKQFNDTRGHLAGDQALQLVAEAMKGAIGPEDRAYRLGGEEFLLVLKAASIGAAGARAERVREAVAELALDHPASPLGKVSLSIGVAQLDRSAGMSIERWIRLADEALYVAKQSGRDRVSLSPGETPRKAVRLAASAQAEHGPRQAGGDR